MSKQIYKQKNGRRIEVLSLFDSNSYGVKDLGQTKDGDDTQSRATARATLLKTRVVNGKDVRCFMLAKAPAVLHPSDKFDRDILKDPNGNWLEPSADWLALRETFIGRRVAAAADAKQIVANKATQNLIASLKTLVENDPSAAPAVQAVLEGGAAKKAKA